MSYGTQESISKWNSSGALLSTSMGWQLLIAGFEEGPGFLFCHSGHGTKKNILIFEGDSTKCSQCLGKANMILIVPWRRQGMKRETCQRTGVSESAYSKLWWTLAGNECKPFWSWFLTL